MDLNKIAFEIISNAGDSFSDSMTAFNLMNENKIEESKEIIKSAKDNLRKAHLIHSELLFDFAKGKEIIPNILLVHSQDHLTKAETFIVMVEQFMLIKQELIELKGK